MVASTDRDEDEDEDAVEAGVGVSVKVLDETNGTVDADVEPKVTIFCFGGEADDETSPWQPKFRERGVIMSFLVESPIVFPADFLLLILSARSLGM